ncbi:flagellar hook-length control protein FliK [Sphingomonas sp.]|uniref:flagellar hook-length control protein FliK n=1 Tax=Sphingomonas sp. TaxID=28214 RepID=UPI002C15D0A7|nr:flagellar hook-length control protein FliK [Sphingomonas sp.]HTG37584.1 flagellar hook-length control protein FliK [Sphingomonas sp.]
MLPDLILSFGATGPNPPAAADPGDRTARAPSPFAALLGSASLTPPLTGAPLMARPTAAATGEQAPLVVTTTISSPAGVQSILSPLVAPPLAGTGGQPTLSVATTISQAIPTAITADQALMMAAPAAPADRQQAAAPGKVLPPPVGTADVRFAGAPIALGQFSSLATTGEAVSAATPQAKAMVAFPTPGRTQAPDAAKTVAAAVVSGDAPVVPSSDAAPPASDNDRAVSTEAEPVSTLPEPPQPIGAVAVPLAPASVDRPTVQFALTAASAAPARTPPLNAAPATALPMAAADNADAPAGTMGDVPVASPQPRADRSTPESNGRTLEGPPLDPPSITEVTTAPRVDLASTASPLPADVTGHAPKLATQPSDGGIPITASAPTAPQTVWIPSPAERPGASPIAVPPESAAARPADAAIPPFVSVESQGAATPATDRTASVEPASATAQPALPQSASPALPAPMAVGGAPTAEQAPIAQPSAIQPASPASPAATAVDGVATFERATIAQPAAPRPESPPSPTATFIVDPATAAPATAKAASAPSPIAAPRAGKSRPSAPIVALPVDAAPATPTGARTDQLLRARPNTAFAIDLSSIAPPTVEAAAVVHIAPHDASAPLAATAATPVDTGRQEWLAAMIDRIETVLGADGGGTRETRITLSPDALGEVSVQLVETDQGITVMLDAATPEAQALLAEAAPRLADMAETRGLKLNGQAMAGHGEQQGGQQRAPHRPDADAPLPNRRAQPGAVDPSTDERIA